MTLYEEYVSGWKNFEAELSIFESDTQKKLLRKLKREKDRANFLSSITEVNFGIFYAQNGATVEYEKKYQVKDKKQEPDWTITLNDQVFLSEVLRLNPTQKDQKRNDFGVKLLNAIEQLEGSYFVEVNYQDEYFRVLDFSLDDIVKELKDWFSTERKLGDSITLFNNFTFTIISANTYEETVLIAGNFNSIDIDRRRLESSNSEFYKKVDKYADLIEQTNMPFVISLYIDFKNGLDREDVLSFLYGKSVDDRIINSEYTEFTSGLFYNDNAKKYLSGVMLRYNSKHTFFYNYFRDNKLNSANRDFFKKFAPPDN